MAMIFTLVATLKDEAEQIALRRREDAAKVHHERVMEAERKENEKFQGTMVNRETFLKWRDDFVKEMEEKRQKEEDDRLAELKKAQGKRSP